MVDRAHGHRRLRPRARIPHCDRRRAGVRAGVYEDVLARTRFGEPRQMLAPGRPDLVRDVDSVVDGLLSMSSSAPHLFGDRLDAFEQDARAAPLSFAFRPLLGLARRHRDRCREQALPTDCRALTQLVDGSMHDGRAPRRRRQRRRRRGRGWRRGSARGRELARIASIWPRASDYARRVAERNRCSRVGDISVIINSSALPRRAKSSR
jgi:hypothetical protein